jgi:hypothetical protein
MTPAQVEATKKSASDALQVAAKCILLKSFIISKTIIGTDAVKYVRGAVRVPEVRELAKLTVKELINLTNLTIEKVEWFSNATLSFTLSNGETCTGGSDYKVKDSHTFDQNKKITKVECIIQNDKFFTEIYFYYGQETLLQVGHSNYSVKRIDRREESFEIAADEQLIGAELYHDGDYYRGVTFLKCKIFK